MTESSPSFIRNRGQISYTFQDVGAYGEFLNTNRLNAWRRALELTGAKREGKSVDLGCSYGSWADNWQALGLSDVTGLDVNADVIEQARNRLGKAEHGGSGRIAALPSPPDNVACNGMIVHVLDEDEELRIFTDVRGGLKPNGWFFVSVLNSDFYLSPSGFQPHTGPNSCTRTLDFHESLLAKAGFEIAHTVGTFINPWFCEGMRKSADKRLQEDGRFFVAMTVLADALRDADQVKPFSEVLLACRAR
ncbi:methyltransferase domain-containing protein [Hyphobacterium sp. HN65]|uniref:Methyltransferase domain-containing protein n=1 Tax=Hyphobacterium lacteum TaxID=3116575 RepID=A0ABU7LQQ8_9PROT|nr:methyltransferase domain-containing protein [Hyphobacterium sp. HN65]MEE2526242.1 methyltransferase domain-containing protein [Hyphobacterium sp. HN65]